MNLRSQSDDNHSAATQKDKQTEHSLVSVHDGERLEFSHECGLYVLRLTLFDVICTRGVNRFEVVNTAIVIYFSSIV